MLEQLKDWHLQEIDVKYQIDWDIFNIVALDARTKTPWIVVLEFQYADDAIVCAHPEEGIMYIFVEVYMNINLTINVRKTKVRDIRCTWA